jgi:TonB family protein
VNQLSSRGELFQAVPPSGRSWPAVVTSAVVHMAIVLPVLYFVRDSVATVLPHASHVLAFVSTVPAPDPVLVLPLSAPRKEQPRVADPIAAFTEPAPEPVVARVEPKPVVPEPRREVPAKVDPPKATPPPPPAVTVGTFAASVPSARTTDPVRTVQSAGFDAPAARAPELKSAPAVTGAFDASPANANTRPGSDRAAVVAEAGFGAMNTVAPAARENRAIADAGFGSQPAAATRSAAPQAVRASGFDAPPPATAVAQPARATRIDVPVEILSKPTPAYTDEARALKLEGEVVLEVEFCARGELKVLRLVRGLGHGLDESATRAAQAIRFKPAQTSGRPVDFRSTVHIVFRLA